MRIAVDRWSMHIASLNRRHIEQTCCGQPSVYCYMARVTIKRWRRFVHRQTKKHIIVDTHSRNKKVTHLWNQTVWRGTPPVACTHQITSPNVVIETSDAVTGQPNPTTKTQTYQVQMGAATPFFSSLSQRVIPGLLTLLGWCPLVKTDKHIYT